MTETKIEKTSTTVPTPEELTELGHEPMSALQALRLQGLDCCYFQPIEVAMCPRNKCPSWPFRLGHNPWKKRREPTEAQLAALSHAARKTLVN